MAAITARSQAHLAAMLIAAAGAAHAAVINVPADVPTIQGAIILAQPGDEVLVAPGTYAERIDFLGKALTVRSSAGPGETIIDGGGARAFTVKLSGQGSVLEGFTVTGGGTPASATSADSGGVKATAAAAVLRDCFIVGNSGARGAGICITGGTVAIEGCRVEGNSGNVGGGLYSGGASLTITGSVFTGNSVVNNGGGAAVAGGSFTLRDTSFESNTAVSYGSGLFLNHVAVDISGLTAFRNGTVERLSGGAEVFTSFGGGGLYATGGTRGLILDSTFTANAAAAGGGLYIASSSAELTAANILVNANISGIAGAGVYVNTSSPRIINATIVNNSPGGIFSNYVSRPVVSGAILTGNDGGNPLLAGTETYGTGEIQLAYSVVDGPVLAGTVVGPGVAEARPVFADPAGPDGLPGTLDDDFSLAAGSAGIDAGDNTALPPGVVADLAGRPRFVDDPATVDTGAGLAPIVDAGAYEFQPAPCPADHTRDGLIDFSDYLEFMTLFDAGDPRADHTDDGIVDFGDYLEFLNLYDRGC